MAFNDPPEPEIEMDRDFVRPFLATAGRTRSSLADLRMETLVEATAKLEDGLRFEAARIAKLCREPNSVAEISAKLKIPLGTVKVIVGDLVGSNHVRTHKTIEGETPEDMQLISRLIAGVRKL